MKQTSVWFTCDYRSPVGILCSAKTPPGENVAIARRLIPEGWRTRSGTRGYDRPAIATHFCPEHA